MPKKKILVLGVTGMLGHEIYKNKHFNEYFLYGTTSKSKEEIKKINFLNNKNIFTKLKIENKNLCNFEKIIKKINPDIVINCIGLIKQKQSTNSEFIFINSYFPHKLQEIIEKINENIKLIQISTDCVFNGKKGNYTEKNIPDETEIYGNSKYFGELNKKNVLTIRTSIYGRELFSKKSLLEWFINSKKKILNGYSNFFFSGLSTMELSRILSFLIKENKKGLIHISSNKISKYSLLKLFNKKFNLNKKIIKYSLPSKIDKSLKSCYKSNYKIKTQKEMINEYL
jgi:dTDP-4-dehydrorhamnose reductase